MDARDRQVALETVRPASECHHCNPGVDGPMVHQHAARDDVTPIRVSALPPWECCGWKGYHSPLCPWSPYDDPEVAIVPAERAGDPPPSACRARPGEVAAE